MKLNSKKDKRLKIRKRIRSKIFGKGHTLFSSTSLNLKKEKLTKTEIAKSIGAEIAEKAIKKGIKTVVFDRGGFIYHGRIKAFAESAREKGLKF